ncbi:MAG: hypothetical protein A2V81_03390 [Candidatus Abawacabacteria bacterium RBG_16_42_10]|uniref:Probable transcriptional regulatory protein A2V81_03390 n=1 Tax=Candidatus Abawacabacteria bacterium RBG_16_42_10 TaxID=1817814 RepID=A0A1F4XLX2_9BACT|nr:MAG: hypothetical protein A2V81_03390 [Candidatus Abawacabacteria bacterium RBG_16_42_10]
MSGHSKWATTKRHKWAVDAKRSNKFTKHAKLIAVAARNGGDPESNSALRLAVDKARLDNMPNANIERAIKKGTGELKEGNEIQELYYEAYGPGGAALYIQVLTDNKNRTASEIREILKEFEGTLAESGAVSFLFEKKAIFFILLGQVKDKDALELSLIDLGVSDIETTESELMIAGDYTLFGTIKDFLEKLQYQIKSSEIRFVPKASLEVNEKQATILQQLVEALDANDDVNDVFINVNL